MTKTRWLILFIVLEIVFITVMVDGVVEKSVKNTHLNACYIDNVK